MEERFTRKQEKTDQILAVLLEGQGKLFQREEKEEPVCRRWSSQDETDGEWKTYRNRRMNEREALIEEDVSGGERCNWRLLKLEIPPFSGEDLDSWIRKAEKYFSFYQSNEREKLEAATVSFEGEAEMWFDWEEQNGTMRNWYNLKKLIHGRFWPWDEREM